MYGVFQKKKQKYKEHILEQKLKKPEKGKGRNTVGKNKELYTNN